MPRNQTGGLVPSADTRARVRNTKSMVDYFINYMADGKPIQVNFLNQDLDIPDAGPPRFKRDEYDRGFPEYERFDEFHKLTRGRNAGLYNWWIDRREGVIEVNETRIIDLDTLKRILKFALERKLEILDADNNLLV